MYRHEIYRHDAGREILMRHYREAILPSGLTAMHNIAESVGISTEPVTRSGLRLPNPWEVRHFAAQEASLVPEEEITCGSLDEFRDKGIEAWTRLVRGLGEWQVLLSLGEVRQVDAEEVPPSGLITPTNPTDTFVAFKAYPDEIEALEAMTAAITAHI